MLKYIRIPVTLLVAVEELPTDLIPDSVSESMRAMVFAQQDETGGRIVTWEFVHSAPYGVQCGELVTVPADELDYNCGYDIEIAALPLAR